MGRKQESGFGVVARTGVALVALGFGSALFGALVVGPGIGSFLNRDEAALARKAEAETRLASANLEPEADHTLRTAVATAQERPEAKPAAEASTASPSPFTEDGTENPDLERYEEGVGAETGLPPDADLTAETTVASAASEPAPAKAPTAIATPEPAPAKAPTATAAPEPAKVDEPRPVAQARPRESTREVAQPETRTTPRAERRRESATTEERKSAEVRETRRAERSTAAAKPAPEPTKSSKAEPAKPAAQRETADTAPKGTEPKATPEKLYRVRVGRVSPRADAEKLRDELRELTGVDAFLVRSGDGYRVQTGAYRDRANAERIAAELRAGNFRPEVTED